MEFLSSSAVETMNFAENLAKKINQPKIFVLSGDLGAGKTTFSKGFAKGLGVEEIITSPTFTILNEYSGRLSLFHFDMYRLGSVEEAYALGFEEYFNNPTGVILVEWAENVPGLIQKPYTKIVFEKIDDEKRKITLEEIVWTHFV